MKTSRYVPMLAAFFACSWLGVGCGGDDDAGTAAGASGAGGAAGTSGAGGSSATAGVGGASGTAGTGGASGTSGASGASGASGTGGMGGTGGTSAVTCPKGSHSVASGACEAELVGWADGPKLKHKRDHHVTFVAETASGPFLYVAAGMGSSAPTTAIERASIAPDGSLSDFTDAATLPKGLIGPGLAQSGRSLVIGGGLTSNSNSTTSTYVGIVADDGGISFTPGPELASSRYHVSFVYVKGFVFAIGGLYQSVSGSTVDQKVVDTIERASFDGTTLSPFETLTPFPVKITHHATVVYNDSIYVIGGGSGAAAVPDIRKATVSDEGELGAWESAGQLSAGRASPAATIFLDQLYVLGGMTSLTGGEVATVLRGPFDSTGNLGSFSDLAPLPLERAHSHQTPFYAGHLYSVGGSIEHAPQADVFVGTLQ